MLFHPGLLLFPLLDETFFYEVNLFLPLLLPAPPHLSWTKFHRPLALLPINSLGTKLLCPKKPHFCVFHIIKTIWIMQNCHSRRAKSSLSNSHCTAIGWVFFLKYFRQSFYQNGSFFCLISLCSWP